MIGYLISEDGVRIAFSAVACWQKVDMDDDAADGGAMYGLSLSLVGGGVVPLATGSSDDIDALDAEIGDRFADGDAGEAIEALGAVIDAGRFLLDLEEDRKFRAAREAEENARLDALEARMAQEAIDNAITEKLDQFEESVERFLLAHPGDRHALASVVLYQLSQLAPGAEEGTRGWDLAKPMVEGIGRRLTAVMVPTGYPVALPKPSGPVEAALDGAVLDVLAASGAAAPTRGHDCAQCGEPVGDPLLDCPACGAPGWPREAAELVAKQTSARLVVGSLGFESAEARNSDALDFNDCPVWQAREALEEAFMAGRAYGLNEPGLVAEMAQSGE